MKTNAPTIVGIEFLNKTSQIYHSTDANCHHVLKRIIDAKDRTTKPIQNNALFFPSNNANQPNTATSS